MADKKRIEDMTLRDYFAAHASEQDINAQQQWTANTMESRYQNNSKPKLTLAECRYRHADAMLTARDKGGA